MWKETDHLSFASWFIFNHATHRNEVPISLNFVLRMHIEIHSLLIESHNYGVRGTLIVNVKIPRIINVFVSVIIIWKQEADFVLKIVPLIIFITDRNR